MGLYFQGLTMGLAYVAPIGMQNLFVINSALTRTRRNALITAVIVIFFDIVLSLACFFGIGALMQAHPWLQTVVLGLGGAVVVRIGLGLLLPKKKLNNIISLLTFIQVRSSVPEFFYQNISLHK